ncbi:hypothetical protein [Chryseobacterium sp.]|uniref:hypothetical protein n=1 Tax=Chryseobacterium sp. TaxID=1871047 RepID=UPI0032193D8E
MTNYIKPDRDFEKELLDIQDEYSAKNMRITENTLNLFDASKDLILFNIRKNSIIGKLRNMGDVIRCSLRDIDRSIDIDYSYYSSIGMDRKYSVSWFISSTYFDNNELCVNKFLDLAIKHTLENGFIIDVPTGNIKEK